MSHSKKAKNRGIALDLNALIETSKILNASQDLDFILSHILRTVMGKLLIFRACIITCEEQSNSFELASHRGLKDAPIKIKALEQFKSQFELCHITPIKSNETLVGYLCLGQKFNNDSFSPSEISFLDSLASLAASAIENAVYFRKLHQLNQTLEQKINQLGTLFQLSNELKLHKSRREVFDPLFNSLESQLNIAQLLVISKHSTASQMEYAKNIEPDSNLLEASETLLNIKQPIRLDKTAYSLLAQRGFQVCIPLKTNVTFGIVLCGSRNLDYSFSDPDLEFLYLAANHLAVALEQFRFFDEALKRKALEKELDVAFDIQTKLFPKNIPSDDNFDIATYYKPSRQVGGDYYDSFEIDHDHIFLAIADVTGKGIPASLLMSNLQALIKAYIELIRLKKMSLFEMVGKINNIIFENTSSDKFISFFCAVIEKSTRTIQSVNAGHNPPILIKASGEICTLTHGGIVLGVVPTPHAYDYESHHLENGDLLLLYTDGITETMNHKREEFGEERLIELLLSNMDNSSGDILDQLINRLNDFAQPDQQHDDTTAICLKLSNISD